MKTRPSLVAVLLVVTAFAGLLVVGSAGAEPTPGLGCRLPAAGAPLPRIVPEPEAALDYISFDEATECLTTLNKTAPDYVELKVLGKSAGWPTVAGSKLASPVYLVEVTNEKSAVPFEHKLKNIYFLSIHGNEKGGREGGLRAIEDLARGIGIAQENPKLREYLDFMVAVFVFANPDGWVHEDATVIAANPAAGGIPGGFVRTNGNGFDLNRQWPNKGWTRESYKTLSQPEIVAAVKAVKGYTNWAYGTDIHGMLTPTDANAAEYQKAQQGKVPQPGGSLLEGLLSAGQSDPHKMLKTTRVAELLKDRVNKDPYFIEWSQAPNTGFWGGLVNEWGTSWDTIGYVDSGFTGDFFFQNHGLNVGEMDFEMAYNHAVFDNHYIPGGMEMNRLHVRLVRQIVAVFMEAAASDVQVSYETHGTKTAYLYNPKVFTNKDAQGGLDELTGWAKQNANDDEYDFEHVDFHASPNDYFTELRPFLRDGDKPGILDSLAVKALTAENLANYDNLVIAGSALEQLANQSAPVAAIQQWAQKGGTLVLTDQSIQLLGHLGSVPSDKINSAPGYAGYTNFLDKASPLAKGLRGLARQTYEAVPIGYEPGRAPNWYVDQEAWKTAGGASVGGVNLGGAPAGGGLNPLGATATGRLGINLGEVKVGGGTVRILGSLLPDPTEEYYHPYGLDSYATTYTGNLLLRNMLGWEEIYAAPPVVVENLGNAQPLPGASESAAPLSDKSGSGTPGFEAGLLVLAALALVSGRRLRRSG